MERFVYVTYYKFSFCECDVFNYLVIEYSGCMCLNRSCKQHVLHEYNRAIITLIIFS